MEQPEKISLGQDQIDALVGLYKQGRLQEALAAGLALAGQHPNVPFIPNFLGAVYTGLGQKDEAITSYRKALEINPDNATTHNNLGVALNSLGRHKEAVSCFQKALELNPDYTVAHMNLANNLNTIGKYEEAVASYERALELNPDHADTHNNLGAALNSLGRYGDAAVSFKKAVEINPASAEAHNNLGATLNSLGRYEEAVASCHRAVKLNARFPEAHMNLGNSLSAMGKYEEAVGSYQMALELNDRYPEAHRNLGITLARLGRHEEAIASLQMAVDLDKNYLSARGNLLRQLALICDWDRLREAMQSELRSLVFGVHSKAVVSPFNLLSLIDDARFHRRVAEAYVVATCKPNLSLGPLLNRRSSDRIRIGYFSADFHNHATMYLMAELFERHDRSKFEIHAFSFGPDKTDGMRSRLLNSVEGFHDVRSKGNAEIAALSRSLGIDIAVDLKGYTRDNRVRIFSYRAAPLQVNYLGYPGTMGAPYFDYIIADAVLIPPEYRDFYSEKVVYLPGCYQVNDSTREISDMAMSRTEFGLPDDAFVFCCFNKNYKIMPDVFDIWMRLLSNIEGSVLWLLKANQTAEQNLRKEATRRGINPDRLIFAEPMRLTEHLARHRLADLFLDTFNYNAHTTASDALWAGLPVLTKMGESFPSRVAGSLLTAVGLPELITTTAQEYEDNALRLARHPQELGALKEKLSHNLETSTLFDATFFTRQIEAAFTYIFERLRQGLQPDHVL